MTRYTPLWIQPGVYPAAQDRQMLGAVWPGPASSGLACSNSGLIVTVQPGVAAIPTANGSGTTLGISDAPEQVALASPPASNSRVDLICVLARGNDLDGGSNNDLIFTSVTGTASASPVAPATPAGMTALAQATVTSVGGVSLYDIRPWALNPVLIGGTATTPAANVVPVTITGRAGQSANLFAVYDLPTNSLYQFNLNYQGYLWSRSRQGAFFYTDTGGQVEVSGGMYIYPNNNAVGSIGHSVDNTYNGVDTINMTLFAASGQTSDLLQMKIAGGTKTTWFDALGMLHITAPSAVVPLTVAGGVGSSANAFEIRNSANALQFAIKYVPSPYLTTPTPEIVLEQTGDTYGTTRLHLQNRGGSNGAMFENVSMNLVDFGFRPQTMTQANLRFEGRGSGVDALNNTYGEFEFLSTASPPAMFAWMGSGGAGVLGRFTIGLAGATAGAANAANSLWGSGTGPMLFLSNDTADPSTNPTGGAIIYSSAGVLKARTPDGSITTLAPSVGAVAPLTLTSTAAAMVPLTLVGAAGQTGDLLDIKNSGGTVISKIDSAGSHWLGSYRMLGGFSSGFGTGILIDSGSGYAAGAATLYVPALAPMTVAVNGPFNTTATVSAGAYGANTNPIFQSSPGAGFTGAHFRALTAGTSTVEFQVVAGGATTIQVSSASAVPLRINAAASQTGNLLEFWNSGPQLMLKVTAAGDIAYHTANYLSFVDTTGQNLLKLQSWANGAWTDNQSATVLSTGLAASGYAWIIGVGGTNLTRLGINANVVHLSTAQYPSAAPPVAGYRLQVDGNILAGGSIGWGPAASAADAQIARQAVGTLRLSNPITSAGVGDFVTQLFPGTSAGGVGDTVLTIFRGMTATEYLRIAAASGGTALGGANNTYYIDTVSPSSATNRPLQFRRSSDGAASFQLQLQIDTNNNLTSYGGTLQLQPPTGVNAFLVLQAASNAGNGIAFYPGTASNSWQFYTLPSDMNFYFRDLTNARMQLTFTPGTTPQTSYSVFNSCVGFNGLVYTNSQSNQANIILQSCVSGDAFQRFQVTTGGTMYWGQGTASPQISGKNGVSLDAPSGTQLRISNGSSHAIFTNANLSNDMYVMNDVGFLTLFGSTGANYGESGVIIGTLWGSHVSEFNDDHIALGWRTSIGSPIGNNAPAGVYGGGAGPMLFLANDTADPTSNPTGGVILYSSSGVLKMRNPSGAITQIAPFPVPLILTAPGPTNIPLVIQGAAGQTADLLEFQNSASGLLARFDGGGNLFAGNLSTYGTIYGTGATLTMTTTGTELVLEQTGDTIGTSRLHLRNRGGAAGALFENPAINVVDFAFQPQTAAQANFRLEGRAGSLADSGNATYGEFQQMVNALGLAVPHAWTGTVGSGVRGRFAIGGVGNWASGVGSMLYLAQDTTDPTGFPTGGALIYAQASGAIMARTSDGNITQIAPTTYRFTYNTTLTAPTTASSPYTVNHLLGTTNVMVELWDAVTLQMVQAQVRVLDANNISVSVSANMPNNINVVVFGVPAAPVPVASGDYANKAYVDARTPNLPAPVSSGSGVQSFTDTLGDVWVAANGVYSGAWKRARDVLHAHYRRNSALTLVASTWTQLYHETRDTDVYGLYASPGVFTVPIAGMWRFDHNVAVTATATAQQAQSAIYLNGGLAVQAMVHSSMATWLSAPTFFVRQCVANDQIQTYTFSNAALAILTTAAITHCSASYLGTG